MNNAVLSMLMLLPLPLTEQLASKSYKTRAVANNSLACLGRLAIPTIEYQSKSHKDPEVRARCRGLLSPYVYELAARDSLKILPRDYPRLPWFHCECFFYEEWGQYMDTARHLCGSITGAPNWPEYRLATRLWLISQLVQRRPMPEILNRLDEMANVEINWIRENGHTYTPQITLPKGSR